MNTHTNVVVLVVGDFSVFIIFLLVVIVVDVAGCAVSYCGMRDKLW